MEASPAMNRSKNLAARAGRWSAAHPWKAIGTWLVFVIAAVMIGGSGLLAVALVVWAVHRRGRLVVPVPASA